MVDAAAAEGQCSALRSESNAVGGLAVAGVLEGAERVKIALVLQRLA